MKTPEDEEFERIEKESGWRKRQIMAEDDDDIQDYKKPWVGLTELEKAEITSLKWWDWEDTFDIEGFIRAIEAKLKEKNT